MIITEEPEFVFDVNLVRGIGHLDVSVHGIDDVVNACFRRLTREEAANIESGAQFYVNRHMYGDKRFPYIDKAGMQLLFGYMRVTAIGKEEIFPRRVVLKYKTAGISEAQVQMYFELPGWQPEFYKSPDLEKINQLIAQYGEGIVIPPTEKECKDFVKSVNRK